MEESGVQVLYFDALPDQGDIVIEAVSLHGMKQQKER